MSSRYMVDHPSYRVRPSAIQDQELAGGRFAQLKAYRPSVKIQTTEVTKNVRTFEGIKNSDVRTSGLFGPVGPDCPSQTVSTRK